jgi:hypothetical protein
LCEDSFGFLAGEADYIGDRVFFGEGVFGDMCRMDVESEARLGEEFVTARRG